MSMQNYRTGRLTLAGLLAAVILMLPVASTQADGAPATAKQIVQTPLSDAPAYAKRALVIGIDGYQNVPKLTDCDNDAHRVAAFLRDKMGFTDVTVMTDDRATPDNLQPTYTHITRQFNLLLDNIVPNQTQIVVFYSGHGVRTQNSQNGDADWLVPLDADPSDISQTCYNYSRFKSMLDTTRPARALLIMDACRNILQGKAAVGGSGFGGASVPLGPQIAELLSCEPTQTSLEGDPADFSESVFTHFLLKGLGGDPDAVDPNVDAVTFDSLMKYVQGQVSAYAQTRLNSAQLPTGAATFGSMILASSLANTVNVTAVDPETAVSPAGPPGSPGQTQPSPSPNTNPPKAQPTPSALSLRNLLEIGLALKFWLQDFNGKLPTVKDAATMKAALDVYVRFAEQNSAFIDPVDGKPYLPNTSISHRMLESFKLPSRMVFCYEANPAPDGTRGVVFLDGSAMRLSRSDWERVKAYSHIPGSN